MKNENFASISKEAMEIERNPENYLQDEVSTDNWTLNQETVDENESFEDYEDENDERLTEINLYDHEKSQYENFEYDDSPKYILFRVDKSGFMKVDERTSILPNPQSKCVVNFSTFDNFSTLEFMPIAYDSFMGIEVLNFIKYNSKFFTCDERVMFITMLVKFKSFDFRPFFWSREVIFKELGIKKDRANKIIKKFTDIGILSSEIKRTTINNRPHQITYFEINADKVVELLPQILVDYDEGEYDVEHDIKKYLKPALK